MSELDHLKTLYASGRLSRRDFLGRAAALGLAAPAMSGLVSGAQAAEEGTPKKGGTLKLGMGGGSTSDSFNPLVTDDSVMLDVNLAIYNTLVENGADNRPVPKLAEKYEPKTGATEWILDLRKGVQFHNGKEFDADDAIYSLNLHRGDTKSGAAGTMKAVTDIKKLGKNQIQITLASGNADLPTMLADYHLAMVPNEFKDWSKPVGTGAFTVERFDPGVRISLKKAGTYWMADRGFLDAAEFNVINDTSARMNALISGQVDVINRADPKTVSRIEKSPTLAIVRAAGGWFPVMAMQVDRAPYNNPDIRRALQYAVDREQMIKTLFSGYGSIGNDNPIPRGDPLFNSELAQIKYDPDKARSLLKKAGIDNPNIVLQASDAAFNGAVDMGVLLQATAGKAGITVNVKKEPADGYFSNVWLKGAFVASYWGGRPAATEMLEVAYGKGAPWNETHWADDQFEKLLSDAKAETDDKKRKSMVWELQAILTDRGGSLIPCFRDWLDAHNRKVGGHTPHGGFDMDNGLIAEKAWIKA